MLGNDIRPVSMCDSQAAGEDELFVDETIFLYHIDQLKHEENRDICRIASVLLEAHRLIKNKFQDMKVSEGSLI